MWGFVLRISPHWSVSLQFSSFHFKHKLYDLHGLATNCFQERWSIFSVFELLWKSSFQLLVKKNMIYFWTFKRNNNCEFSRYWFYALLVYATRLTMNGIAVDFWVLFWSVSSVRAAPFLLNASHFYMQKCPSVCKNIF